MLHKTLKRFVKQSNSNNSSYIEYLQNVQLTKTFSLRNNSDFFNDIYADYVTKQINGQNIKILAHYKGA